MKIWYHNKETNEGEIFGSRKAASDNTGVDVDHFYYHFNKNKGGKTEFEEGPHQFKLRPIIRSKRK